MIIHGHHFKNFKSEEMICWACGFVIWRCASEAEAEKALAALDGGACPGEWHGQHKPIPLSALVEQP